MSESNIKEYDSYLDFDDGKGNVERHYPFTKFKNIEDIPQADEETVAPVKLYSGTGNNEDGALSQKSSTDKFEKVQRALLLLAANSYIIDDVDGKTYKIGSENGQLYLIPSDVSVKEIAEMIITAVESLTE